MKLIATFLMVLPMLAHADELGLYSAGGFDEIVRLHKTGESLSFAEVSNFTTGLCFSIKAKKEAHPSVLVSKTEELYGEQVTKMALYFLPDGVDTVEPDSAIAAELLTFLEDDWRYWSPVKEKQGLHFFYDIEDNGRLDAKVLLVRSGSETLLTYKNLIGQKLTFMGQTFRSRKNQVIGACTFGGN